MRRKHLIKKIRSSFECGRCNLCCSVPGFVYLTGKDAKRISAHLKISESEFISTYCAQDEGRLVLHSRANDDCIFLEETGCSIHEVKPRQCSDFPYRWRDPDAYDYCEGIKALKATLSD